MRRRLHAWSLCVSVSLCWFERERPWWGRARDDHNKGNTKNPGVLSTLHDRCHTYTRTHPQTHRSIHTNRCRAAAAASPSSTMKSCRCRRTPSPSIHGAATQQSVHASPRYSFAGATSSMRRVTRAEAFSGCTLSRALRHHPVV